MATSVMNTSGHLQAQLTRSLDRVLEDASLSIELKLSGRKLKEFPKTGGKYNLNDTVVADKRYINSGVVHTQRRDEGGKF
ncbi:hypothetical protein J437_LFUL002293 [Ladona fulva]|uniref:Uncharacterized protein n=1 Tax=Ladona fulva TaxID=123851 RepID=A0A8K0JXK6_LADFU|nr:hypothetical protein J437_LFUL002293 [Ladona fulva]